MTLEELEKGLDDVVAITDEAERRASAVILKSDMRKYKEERDEVEGDHMARVEALENDVKFRDDTIDELRKTNSRLAEKFGNLLLDEDVKESEIEDKTDELDDLIKRFD